MVKAPLSGRFLQPAVVQPGTSRIDQSSTGNYSSLGGSSCSSRWPTPRFQLLEGESIELRQYGLRDDVAQLSVFEVVVGNCKLLFLCSAISSRLMGSASDERMLEIWIIGWLRSGAFDLSDIKKHVSIYSELDVSPDFQGTDICVKPSQGDLYLGKFMCYIFQAAEMLSLVKLDPGFLSICSSLGGQSYLVPVAGGKWQHDRADDPLVSF
ncbi:hypothetical protein CQW23_11401 [Capsicum baccatum]|uniref:Uncharacterized protein n=1 Tax=Capsicum baccatum TaxID=33114 RepID=A0A2G2WPM1_CAPBA|nr:hypothetical protein CQW23_11401 [Capsicum baccatum]